MRLACLSLLAPADAGWLAARAGVKTLILTHDAIPRSDLPAARQAIAAAFSGKIIFAEDPDSF